MPPKKIGSRYEVFSGKALKTTGNLTKNALKKNKQGRIVSKKASSTARQKSNLGNKLYSGEWQKKAPLKKKAKPKPKLKDTEYIPRKKKSKNFDDLWKDPPKLRRRRIRKKK